MVADAASLVSILIRSMDRPSLERALDSAAAQTHPNLELIVERRAGSRRVSLDEVNARPPAIKLRDGIARLFAPLL